MAVETVGEWPAELSAAQEDEILLANSTGDFVVSDEIGDDVDESVILGEEQDVEESVSAQSQEQKTNGKIESAQDAQLNSAHQGTSYDFRPYF